ncbi:hypothetical protein L7F22_004874, partial [Adiantum nelumboides]|nr:hypothetical protein [Adiantum nelumboides]
GLFSVLFRPKRRALHILKDVSGIIKPSRLTLLLGPPSSGKTSLMLALAGKLSSDLRVSGNVTYNGHKLQEFIPQRTSAYISQHDTQYGMLTVRETLDFSGRCQGVGEMLVGPAKALFMDEISTGLDSSTTFQIVKCLRQSVHVMDATMLVSLLQPAPETFDLFDDVILISEGQVVYQGPREHILEFFRSMGFKCPERKSTADFLQEVTSKKDQQQYWEDRSQPYRYVTVEEFVQAFKSFHVGRKLQQELAILFDKTRSHPAALATSTYGINKSELFKACLAREVLLWKRNSFMYIFKTTQLAVMSSIAMTVYFRTKLHQDSVNDGVIYMGALFYGLVIIMFNGMAEMVMVVNRLPVFYKQRDQLFYPAWSYTIPAILLRAPLSIVECLIWTCLTYFVIGFAPEAGRFFRQILLLFCVSQMALGMFRFLGSVGRTLIIANTFGNIALILVFVMGGFVISRESIRGWWIWAYWSSPLTYGLQALFINEFHADRWQKPYNGNLDADTLGDAILISRGFFTHKKWYWLGIGVLIAFAVMFNILFTLAMTYLKPLGKPQAILPDDDDENISSRSRVQQPTSESRPSNYNRGLNAESAGIDLPTIRPSNPTSGNYNDVENGTIQRRGMLLPFQPLSIAFNAVNYYVDMPPEMKNQGVTEDRLQLLQDVSGAFRPRVLTALVGVSGAGKSTLMDVLAGRKTGGYIEGDISISGYPKKQETFARIAGYCEQNDIHSPNVTVRESLEYSAWLRLPSDVDKKTKKMFVEEVMELVELFPIADALVGLPGINGLSTEQRKRLTIAVELVANPSIIFMDEPTSGLDARAAAIVMRTVRNTVDTGRTVVCTIHQPSIDIFESFDELLLMKRGGRVIYAGRLGTCSAELVKYFEAIPGIRPITDGYNPATWMLEISSPSAEARLQIDFAQIYKDSALYQRNQALIKEISAPLPDSKDLFFPTKYPQSFPEQCLACLWKQHKSYWRNPHYNAVRFLFTTAVALMFGTIFWRLGHKTSTSVDLFNIFGAMYSISLFMGYQNANTVQPVVGIERTVFYRERGAGMYSALAYAFAQATIEIPYCLTQSTIYVLLTYSLINFFWTAAKFFYYFYFIFFTLITFTYFGCMTVAITPDVYISTIITAGFLSLWNLFSGFMIPRVARSNIEGETMSSPQTDESKEDDFQEHVSHSGGGTPNSIHRSNSNSGDNDCEDENLGPVEIMKGGDILSQCRLLDVEFQKEMQIKIYDGTRNLSNEESVTKEKEIVLEVKQKYNDRMQKVFNVINPSLGTKWREILFCLRFDAVETIVGIEKINLLAISSTSSKKKLHCLRFLESSKFVCTSYGMPSTNSKFRAWLSREVLLDVVEKNANRTLEDEGRLALMMPNPIELPNDPSLHSYFATIRKEGKRSIYGNINKKGSKEKNRKKDDSPKQTQLDAAVYQLIYRLAHLNA